MIYGLIKNKLENKTNKQKILLKIYIERKKWWAIKKVNDEKKLKEVKWHENLENYFCIIWERMYEIKFQITFTCLPSLTVNQILWAPLSACEMVLGF